MQRLLENRSPRAALDIPRRWWATTLQALGVAMLVSGRPPAALAADCPPKPNLPSYDVSEPRNLGILKLQLIDYKCFGAYDRDVARVLGEAQAYVEQRASMVKKPAVVLDIDETALSNWKNLSADDFGFIPNGKCTLQPGEACGFNAWILEGQADPIGPTVALFEAAQARGVAVFFITGRSSDQEAATVKNLTDAGYHRWTRLILRPSGVYPTVQAFKTATRKMIVTEGFTIIANVGDQQSDLEGGYAERTFKVPNPFYFIP